MSQFREHMQKMQSLAAIVAMVSMYGVAGVIGWYIAPSFGFGLTGQIAILVIILLTFPIALLVNRYLKRRAQRRGGGESTAPPLSVPTRCEELERSTEEAVQWLRSTKLGAQQSGDAIYSLPWFLFAGPPASGKSALILSSGLNFHVLPSQRSADLQTLRATAHCDWRICDEAVLVDTAGRYQSEGPEADEWASLLEIIKKQRSVRALDGLVIAVNLATLLQCDEKEIEQQAKVMRARIDDAIVRMRTRFPIYLIFTHADALVGFEEFFRVFDRSGRAQVWGVTVPLAQAQQAHTLFDTEFNYLYEALMRLRLTRLAVAAPSAEQLRIFDFPLRFAEARDRLGLFTTALFRPNPFSESPLLRGFYLAGNIPRTKGGITPEAIEQPEQAAIIDARLTGYFVEDLFREVLLRDRDLAASFQAGQRPPGRWRNIATAAAAACLFFFIVGMGISTANNKDLISEGLERGTRVDELARAQTGKGDRDAAALRAELETVEGLRDTLDSLDRYDKDSPPVAYRFGLYTGDALSPYLRAIYFDAINDRYFKSSVAALEKELRQFTAGEGKAGEGVPESELGRYYDLLKAYLMLSEPSRVEAAFLANQLSEYWQRSAPADMEMVARQQLDYFARQAASHDAPHIKPDDKLVAEARRRLTAYPPINRFFKRVTSEIDTKVAPVTVDAITQGRARGLLTGSYAVPGSFTVEGYHGFMREAIESAALEISKDDWVMGAQAVDINIGADAGKLQAIYFREYAAQWQRFVRGVSVRPYRDKDEAVEALKAFTASDSPLALVALEVARQTNISEAPPATGLWRRIKRAVASKSGSLPSGGTEVEKEFLPLQQFVTAQDKKEAAQLSQYRAALRLVLEALETASADQLAQTSKLLLTGKDDIGLQKAELSVGKLLDGFKSASAADAAALLKQPLGNVRALLYGGGYEQIDKSWREQLYPVAHALEAGFPFTDAGSASLTDLARYLNPVNGQLTVFYNDKLSSSFEEAQGQWRLKEAGAFKFSPAFVGYLNGARRVREALFPQGGQQPEVGYEITLQPVTGADVVVEIDGIRAETRGTTAQSAKFVWPARAGTSGAKITVIQNGQVTERAFPGEWGLFKMVASGGGNLAAGQYQLAWGVGTVTVRAQLRPSSAASPFQRSLFTQLRAPQSLRE